MITILAKKVGGWRSAWFIVPTFFLLGAVIVHVVVNMHRWPVPGSELFSRLAADIKQMGLWSIPLGLMALVLFWALIRLVHIRLHNKDIDVQTEKALEMASELSPMLGLLATVAAMVGALTMNIIDIPLIEARALKENLFGVALLTTKYGLGVAIPAVALRIMTDKGEEK